MPQERLTVKKILEILRLHFEHQLSGRAIAVAVCCALSSVQECLRRFVQSGLSWPVECDEEVLIQRLYPKPSNAAALVDYAAVVGRLRSFKGITRDQMMARHQSNHIQVVYTPNEKQAHRAARIKAAALRELGLNVSMCGEVRLG